MGTKLSPRHKDWRVRQELWRNKLKDKKVLITAGPTWVPIDNVRVISNTASGETGILLAQKLTNLGARVTLLLGPVESCCLDKKIKLRHFKFFGELKNGLIKELSSSRYDIVIHSAAVSDYRPQLVYKHKIKSGINRLRLSLVPTPKIIGLIKNIDPAVFLVGFKFETGLDKNSLIKKTRALIKQADLDLAVANTVDHNRYKAYVVNQDKIYGPFRNKIALTKELIGIVGLLITD